MNYARRMHFFFVLFALLFLLKGISSGQLLLGRFDVTTVRRATGEERQGMSAGPGDKWIVRFRLELPSEQGAYLLMLGPKGTPPLGYVLERVSGNIVWRDEGGRNLSRSPGLAKLMKEPGARWIFLPPSAAYEWEVATESASTPGDMSRSVFVRKDMTSAPMELVCQWYSLH
jgi:hypothetical protein